MKPWPLATGETAYVVMKKMLRDSGLTNFRLLSGRRECMEDVYRQYDFTIIPYTHPEGGKECPLSLVEGLGCGLPVLISSAAPFASFVADNGCGAVFDLDPRSFRATLDSALVRYDCVRANAISCASMHFDRQAMFRRFAAIYGSASTACNAR